MRILKKVGDTIPTKYRRFTSFALIGLFLWALNTTMQMSLLAYTQLGSHQAFMASSFVTYVLQFVLNAVFTWTDRAGDGVTTAWRVVKLIMAKVVLWGVNQVVFAIWLAIIQSYVVTQLPLIGNTVAPHSDFFANAFTTGTILFVNYFIFDKFIFTK